MELQNKILQTAKELILYMELYKEKNSKREEKKNEISKNVTGIPKEELLNQVFDEVGSIDLLTVDLNHLKVKLYYYIDIAKDLVEIPQEVKDLIADYKPTFIFTTTGEIVNKDVYNQHKQNFIQTTKTQEILFSSPAYLNLLKKQN